MSTDFIMKLPAGRGLILYIYAFSMSENISKDYPEQLNLLLNFLVELMKVNVHIRFLIHQVEGL
ncbi:MAG: hypothetical protein GY786_14240 [Proteobacteria bacterium]|nr:hypothetical protein [Pseudomonadota bacterium]